MLGVLRWAELDIQRNRERRAVIIVCDFHGLHAGLNQVDVCGQKLPVKSQVFRVFGFQQILGKTLFLEVHFVEKSVYRPYEIVGFLAALIGRFLLTEVELHRAAKIIKVLHRAAFFKLREGHRVKINRRAAFIEVHA